MKHKIVQDELYIVSFFDDIKLIIYRGTYFTWFSHDLYRIHLGSPLIWCWEKNNSLQTSPTPQSTTPVSSNQELEPATAQMQQMQTCLMSGQEPSMLGVVSKIKRQRWEENDW